MYMPGAPSPTGTLLLCKTGCKTARAGKWLIEEDAGEVYEPLRNSEAKPKTKAA
jgi:hypothetical protein